MNQDAALPSFDSCFNSATKSLFRFEGFQDYSGTEGTEEVNIFMKTGKLSEHPHEIEWWREMREKNRKGIVTQRVRLVTRPLSEYTKMELAWHKEAAEYSGDDIRVIEQKDFEKISQGALPDFWIIDDEHVFLLEFGPKGEFLRNSNASETDIAKYVTYKKLLLSNSNPIKDYKG